MEVAGLEEVYTYVFCRHNAIAQYIDTRLILYMCLVEYQRSGMRVARQWL